jgi:hypothetical protein
MDEDSFRDMKGRASTALRRDTRMTGDSRIIGLELMAWWTHERADLPVYGRTNKYLVDTLGLSDATVRAGKADLARFEHFYFLRTGRADLAWPWCVAPHQRSLNFSDQIAEKQRGRPPESGDRKKQDKQEKRERALSQEADHAEDREDRSIDGVLRRAARAAGA